MSEGSIVILSRVPERLSQYMLNLHALTSQFLFFSDVGSLLGRRRSGTTRLIIIDNADDDIDIAVAIDALRRVEAYRTITILAIVKESASDSGVRALEAGANDYLPISYVDRELAIRARMHWNTSAKLNEPVDLGVDFNSIYPMEDRLLMQNALWHIKKHIADISSVSDLSLHMGRSEKDINKAFISHLGLTAFSYIRAHRIDAAKAELVRTRLPIAQIALDVGYSSPANFSTAFKSIVGMSPAQYRREVRRAECQEKTSL
ncbi:AraC family transcriptional regulator [Pusillimonas caeni]|nr:AraC family transcriptional regulator [Pusillimonas caeni]